MDMLIMSTGNLWNAKEKNTRIFADSLLRYAFILTVIVCYIGIYENRLSNTTRFKSAFLLLKRYKNRLCASEKQ